MRRAAPVLVALFVLAAPGLAIFAAGACLEREPEKTASNPASEPAAPLPAKRSLDVASPVDHDLLDAGRTAAERPEDTKAHAKYALLLEQKAREVGNAAFHRMAERAARHALELSPEHELARAALGVALLGEHRFQDALAFVRSLEGKNVWRLSCEVDALYELGRYEEAVERAQALVDRKPGTESFPRVALLREIHGDVEGSLEVWSLAIDENASGSQGLAWASSQRGDVLLRAGRAQEAEACYEAALEAYPGYYMPRVGLARCAVLRGDLALAESLLEPLMPAHGDVPTAALLGDVRLALGKEGLAESTFARALEDEERSARAGVADRRGLAVFLADHDRDPERAVSLAREELLSRPTVFSEDALAWALVKSGKAKEAREHARAARRLGTKNPLFVFHEGAIEIALGERARGAALVRSALATGLAAEPLQARRARELVGGLP